MMFGFRTPTKTTKASNENPQGTMAASQTNEEVVQTRDVGEASQSSSVRRSIGEWESGKSDKHLKTTTISKKSVSAEPPKPKPKQVVAQESRVDTRRKSVEATGSPPKHEKLKYADRLAEARACVTKAKINLGNSRNIKTEIKIEVIHAIERLFQLVKEVESIKGQDKKQYKEQEQEREPERVKEKEDCEIIKKIEEHAKLMEENNNRMEKLKETLEKHQEMQERQTYASVAAAFTRRQAPEQTALHSVVVTSKDETETGEEVLSRIRKVVKAKEGGIVIERIRKAKDAKVIVGCRTEEERANIKERLRKAEDHLHVEDIQNKDPLVILRDVLNYNSDEDVLNALKNQNKDILREDGKNNRLEIMYKKRTRNPHTNHIVMRVSPDIWKRMVEAGSVLVDLQRVRVADQSPLVQCSLCLGYGHGRRFCKETLEKCSHCGGPHMKAECADWLAGTAPSCCNCTHAKMDKADHNAFSTDCKIRRKWEALARATIAYC